VAVTLRGGERSPRADEAARDTESHDDKENSVQEFELTDQAGERWRLSDALQHGAVVLVCYRGDW